MTGAPEGRPGRNTRMVRFHAQCEEPYANRGAGTGAGGW